MPPADAGDLDEDDAVIAAFARPGAAASRPAADPGAAQAGALRCGGAEAGGGGHSVCAADSRSDAAAPRPAPRVLLLDTIGELSGLFAAGRRGLHGRHAGAARRPQYSGAGAVRQARDRRAAHGELPGHRRRVSRRRRVRCEIADAAELAGAVERLLATPDEAARHRARAPWRARRRGAAPPRAPSRRCANCIARHCRATGPAMPWYAAGVAAGARSGHGGAQAQAGAATCAAGASWTCR